MYVTTPPQPSAGLPPDAIGHETELLRTVDVLQLVPFSRTTLWRRVRDGEFPPPVRLGGPNSRIVAYRATDVAEWLQRLVAA